MQLCTHFGVCGGCSLQDVPAADYSAGKRAAVQHALMQAGVTAEVLAPIIVPPHSRRRAVLEISGGEIGFHAVKSHEIVDMHECLLLTPGLFALVQKLRSRFGFLKAPADFYITETLTGFDLGIRSPQKLNPQMSADLAAAVAGQGIVRVHFNNGLVLESAAPQVEEGGVRVNLPPYSFLQSTIEGEIALQERVRKIVGKAKLVADLFSGVGTFALSLARKAKVHAVEQDALALAALAEAAKAPGLKPVTTERRDLFKLPLTFAELSSYDAVVLDPPRAGAEAQVRQLAKSRVPTIAYVSCDARSFARDAAILLQGGYRLGPVTPIDQFLWSSHIEVVAAFVRDKR
jgi:23S rRNA (uracil1939-C5)-methyltransferase